MHLWLRSLFVIVKYGKLTEFSSHSDIYVVSHLSQPVLQLLYFHILLMFSVKIGLPARQSDLELQF